MRDIFPPHSFAQSWGIVIGGIVLQNVLQSRLPETLLSTLPDGAEIVYSVIPTIRTLDEPLKGQVIGAFVEATRRIWIVMAGISGIGFLSCFIMREEEMRIDMDSKLGLKESVATSSDRA